MNREQSQALFKRAECTMPGGVNSPVRAFKAVGGDPLFIQKAEGAYLTDADGNRYIDYIGSWGPMIVGHAHPEVVRAVQDAATQGTSYGAPTEAEIEMSELLCALVPSLEMVRLVSSGTEAVMGALRVARGFTGRDLVVKCEGGYHGGADYLLVKAGSGAATLGEPDSAGIPRDIAKTTSLIPYNDVDALETLFKSRGDEIAAVIIEPVAGNMGCVPPQKEWLRALREQTQKHGALLVFDEVMTGFRVALGGAQSLFGVTPDLSCFGKVIGGGLPVGAYGGKKKIMQKVSPLGPVYQAGTLSGNPLAVAAGRATLKLIQRQGVYEQLEERAKQLEEGLRCICENSNVPTEIQRVGSMLTLFFSSAPVQSWNEASQCDLDQFAKLHAALLNEGIYWPPSQFEAAFISLAHDSSIIAQTLRAFEKAWVSFK